ncbi:(2,3-dihydroxybenzoyl)adenylate synthase [soil metagenome]
MRSPVVPAPTWPPETASRYRALGYWTGETFSDFVADRTTRYAGRLALVGQDAHGVEVRWTYAELAQQSERAAGRLAAAGTTAGDRVVIAVPNIVEYVATVLGVFRMGALPVFALPTHREVELVQFCTITDAAVLVGCGTDLDLRALHAKVAEAVHARDVEPPALVDVATWTDSSGERGDVPLSTLGAEDLAFLQLSGGTTGTAKLIPRTAADYLYSVRASAEICGLDDSTVMLVVLPASHNFAMSSPGILGVLDRGGRVVLGRDPSPRSGFALIARERVTTVALVPPLAQAWISAARRRGPDLTSLRSVQVGGARLNDVTAREVEPVLGARLQQVFGMAEGLVNYTRDGHGGDPRDSDDLVLTTQGTPISADDEIRVVDEADDDVPDGEEGALLTRGPYTIRGYYRAEAVNETSFTTDGFYRTGDLVRRLPSGHLQVTGRDKDQINRAGEKIAAEEIEAHLLAHPDLLDAVAIGLPDAYLGERVCAVLRTEPGREPPADPAGWLRAAGLATYKIPDDFVFLDEFPRTHVGKNSRRELRTLLAARLAGQPLTTT